MLIRSHFKKITGALLAAAVLLSALVLSAGASGYTDVSQGAWYYDSVAYVTSKGLFKGTSDTAFSPGGTMTRGMFITVLGRFAGVDPEDYTDNASRYHSFSDVKLTDYYAGYVLWGYETGIVKGTDSAGTKFSPNATVSREQICAFLNRYIEYAGLSLSTGTAKSFSDESSISSWALSDVKAMQKYGIVEGSAKGDGYVFNPKDSATRAQCAAMFARLGQKTAPAATATPAPTAPPEPEDTATFLSDKISVKSDTLRVGLCVSTSSYSTCVSSVTLKTSGSGFDYGTYNSSREFVKEGSVSSATVSVTTNGTTFTLKNASGAVVYTTSGSLALRPVTSGGEALTSVNGGNRYHGGFELRQAYYKSGYITVINYVSMEDYVRGVLPWEFGPSWPAETLKAAAIAVRTYAMNENWSTYSTYGFDIMGNNGSQTYYGRGKSYSESYFSSVDSAVSATANVYLTYKSNGTNRLCTPFYFSSDGGATEDSANIWGGSYSYLVGKVDPYEESAKKLASNYTYSITNSRTGSTMTALASKLGLTGIAKDGIYIETYPVTGNVKSITLTGTNGKTVTVSQKTSFTRWNFLSAFGFTAYSYRFSVTYDEAADTFTCTRLGWGHNVGMSQWGAYAMAKYYNKTYQQILGFYYDGTHLQYGA